MSPEFVFDLTAEPQRDLTLSEWVARVNSFEGSLVRVDDGFVLELEVYPIDSKRPVPPAVKLGLGTRLRRALVDPRPR
jgi:hypothetical protein